MRKAENCKIPDQKWQNYIIKLKLKFVIIVIKFWKLAFVYIAKLSTEAKLYYEGFQNFGITLLKSHQTPQKMIWLFKKSLINNTVNIVLTCGFRLGFWNSLIFSLCEKLCNGFLFLIRRLCYNIDWFWFFLPSSGCCFLFGF